MARREWRGEGRGLDRQSMEVSYPSMISTAELHPNSVLFSAIEPQCLRALGQLGELLTNTLYSAGIDTGHLAEQRLAFPGQLALLAVQQLPEVQYVTYLAVCQLHCCLQTACKLFVIMMVQQALTMPELRFLKAPLSAALLWCSCCASENKQQLQACSLS